MNCQSIFTLLLLASSTALSGCSHLSSEAKEMVGDYYLTAVSENEPVMELRKDGTCTLHAIKPDVMSYMVNGEWNVKSDSLIIETEGKADKIEGDTTMAHVGKIPLRISFAVADFNGISLTLRRDGADYVYQRRGHAESDNDK